VVYLLGYLKLGEWWITLTLTLIYITLLVLGWLQAEYGISCPERSKERGMLLDNTSLALKPAIVGSNSILA
jgi:hypothetical protein